MALQVPLCTQGCTAIFMNGFSYSEIDFQKSCKAVLKELQEKAGTIPITCKIAKSTENIIREISSKRKAGLCDDGINRIVFAFEEGGEQLQEGLEKLPNKFSDTLRRNVVVFAIHSGGSYRGVTEDLAKIAINIGLTRDESLHGKIDTGERQGKTTKTIHFHSTENPYRLINCVQNNGVRNFVLETLNLAGKAPGHCKTHGEAIVKGETIGPEGGAIIVDGGKCIVEFSPRAVQKNTEFSVSVKYRIHRSVGNDIQITPVVRCMPKIEFLAPVKLKLQTWCRTKSDAVVAHIMMQEDDDGTPSPVAEVPLKVADSMVEFECQHFTSFWAYIKRIIFGGTEYITQPNLYYSPLDGNFALVFLADPGPSQIQHQAFNEASTMLNKFTVDAEKEVRVSLGCENPAEFVISDNPQMFVADENFARVR